MLASLSIFICLFLIALGLIAIYIGVRTYIHLSSATLTTTGELVSERHIMFMHGLTEADAPIYCPSRPLITLTSMVVIGLLPLSLACCCL